MDPKPMAGQSLIGLMTTLAVLALMLGIGLPAWQGLLERERLRTLQDGIAARLHTARAQARRLGHDVSIVVRGGTARGDWCLALDDRGDCDCRLTPCRLAGRPYRPLTGAGFPSIRLSIRPRRAARITYHAGHGTATAGSIRMIARHLEARVIVSSSGRVRRCALGLAGQPRCGPR